MVDADTVAAAAAAAAAMATTDGTGIVPSSETMQPKILTVEEASERARNPDLRRLRANLRTDSGLSRDEHGPGFVIESDRVMCLGVSSEDRDRTFFAAQLNPISGWTELREAEERLGLASFIHVAPTREAGSEFDVNVETVLGLLTESSLMIIVLFAAPTVLADSIRKMKFGFTIALGFGLSKQRERWMFNVHGYESHEPLLASENTLIPNVTWPIVQAVIPVVPSDPLGNECLRLYSRFSTLYCPNQRVYERQSCTHLHDAVYYAERERVRAWEESITNRMARIVYARNAIVQQTALVYVTSWIYSDAFIGHLNDEESDAQNDFDADDEYDASFALGTKDSTMQVAAWLHDVASLLNSPASYKELLDQCYCL